MIPLRDNVPARRFPFVTLGLIAVNVIVFVKELSLPRPEVEALMYFWGVIPARLLIPFHRAFSNFPPGALLTPFTHMFLHGGWLHLLSNMWALWLFGDNVEDRLGHARYALFYILCGLLAIALHVVLHPLSRMPTIGASGAIAGVMGAYFLLFPWARILVLFPVIFYPVFFEIPAAIYLLLWFVLQIYSGAFSLVFGAGGFGGVAFWAHVGGFAAGMYLVRRWRRPRAARVE